MGTYEFITIENLPNSTRDLNRARDWLEELLEKMYGKKAFLDMVQRKDRAIPELGLMSNGPRFAPSRERSMEKPDICENCA